MPIVENRTPSHQNSNAFHAYIAFSQFGLPKSITWPIILIVLKGTAVFHLMQRFCSTGPLKFHFPLKIAEACFLQLCINHYIKACKIVPFIKIDKWPKAFKMQNDWLLLCLTQLFSEINKLLCWCWSVTCADPISPRRLANEVALSWSSSLSPLSSPWSSALMLI